MSANCSNAADRSRLGSLTEYERSRNMLAYAPPSASAAPSVALAPAPRTSRATRSHRSRSSPPKIEGVRPFHPYLSSRSSSTSISGNTVATTPLTSNHVATCPSAEYFDAIRRIDFASSSSASAAAVVSACGTMENNLEGQIRKMERQLRQLI